MNHEGHGDRKRQKGFTTEAQRAQRPEEEEGEDSQDKRPG